MQLSLDGQRDLKQKVVVPILRGDIFLAVPGNKIFATKYLAPTHFEKASRTFGYHRTMQSGCVAFPS
jgi:hypothetical protein